MAIDQAERLRLIEQYEAGPERLRAALARVPAAALKWRPAPAEWSAHEIICHCADSETNAAGRIRYLAVEKDATIIGYDQEAWAVEFKYHSHPLEPALAAVVATRANTAALLRRLPAAAWERVGRHSELGTYSAEEWLHTYAVHLHDHAEQIERNVAAWTDQGGPVG